MNFKAAVFLSAVVIASGCTQINGFLGEEKEAELQLSVSDNRVTNESPGEITLNARNLGNESTFLFALVRPVGQYDQVVRITDREGNIKSGFGLGEAPSEATTGQTFAQVHKKMNISSQARVRVELYRRNQEEVLDSQIVKMQVVEENSEE